MQGQTSGLWPWSSGQFSFSTSVHNTGTPALGMWPWKRPGQAITQSSSNLMLNLKYTPNGSFKGELNNIY